MPPAQQMIHFEGCNFQILVCQFDKARPSSLSDGNPSRRLHRFRGPLSRHNLLRRLAESPVVVIVAMSIVANVIDTTSWLA